MKLSLVLFTLSLVACATSSHILIGNPRAPISPAEVRVYFEPPENYEVIALVRGESVTGWTQQQDTDNAIQQLKAEAAALGANGVLLAGVSEGDNSFYGTGISSTGQTTTYVGGVSSQAKITAKAIWVPFN